MSDCATQTCVSDCENDWSHYENASSRCVTYESHFEICAIRNDSWSVSSHYGIAWSHFDSSTVILTSWSRCGIV